MRPWATEAKETGGVSVGVVMEAKSWSAPMQANVQEAVTASSTTVDPLFMSKFVNLSVGGGASETDGRGW